MIFIRRVAWVATVVTYFLIALGGTVLATDSGLSCPDWPFCYGQAYYSGTTQVFLEQFHRFTAVTVSVLVVLLVIETTDVLFAVDSIPAILAITLNAFIVYTSNVFAILGLRSMYFAVSGLMKVFRFLHYGLAIVLMLVGVKMMASDYFKIPIHATLGTVAGVLLISIALSVAFPKKEKAIGD